MRRENPVFADPHRTPDYPRTGAQPDSILDPEVFVALFDSTLTGEAAPGTGGSGGSNGGGNGEPGGCDCAVPGGSGSPVPLLVLLGLGVLAWRRLRSRRN